MRYSLISIGLLICLTSAVTALGQRPLDDVLVTGQVRKAMLCSRDSDAWIYRFIIRMQAKNVGTRPVIISSAPALVVYYKVATNLDQLNSQQYAHIGWVTSGPDKDPKSVPTQPFSPFETVAPERSVYIDVDFRAVVIGELKPAPIYIQVIAQNWPEYSEEYIGKLKSAWDSHGLLWAHSLQTEPIFFMVPAGLRKARCP
jgi:hypothetical protein